MDPITKGNYPKSMQTLVGNRLPKFSKEESDNLKGSFDFLGLNYYSSSYAADAPHLREARPYIQTDSLVNTTCNQQIFHILTKFLSFWKSLSRLTTLSV